MYAKLFHVILWILWLLCCTSGSSWNPTENNIFALVAVNLVGFKSYFDQISLGCGPNISLVLKLCNATQDLSFRSSRQPGYRIWVIDSSIIPSNSVCSLKLGSHTCNLSDARSLVYHWWELLSKFSLLSPWYILVPSDSILQSSGQKDLLP